MTFSAELIQNFVPIFDELLAKKIKVVCAESCTGGLLSALFTEFDGSSQIFERGFVVYSNQSKIDLLGVEASLIEKYGAVSSEVALEMARGALKNSAGHVAIAITGIAGPTGATLDKEVGTVFIALVSHNFYEVKKFLFDTKNRQKNRELSVFEALKMIKNHITSQKI